MGPETMPWSDFGIAGMVIAVMIWIVRRALDRSDAMQAEHREEREEVLKQHREERAEWRAASERREDKTEKVLAELTEALRRG